VNGLKLTPVLTIKAAINNMLTGSGHLKDISSSPDALHDQISGFKPLNAAR